MKKLSTLLALLLTLVWLAGCTTVSQTETVGEKQGAGDTGVVMEDVNESAASPTEKPVVENTDTTESTVADAQITEKDPSSQKPVTSATKASTTSSTAAQTTGRITKEEAKRIALEQAGASEQQISRYTVELDYDDDARRWEYEISFRVGNVEYDIELAAKDGKVLQVDKETEREPVSSSTNKATISKAKAKSIALSRAGVSEKDISRYEIELDYDDDARRWEYEISFIVGRVEYDVTVDGTTGEVLEYEKDAD